MAELLTDPIDRQRPSQRSDSRRFQKEGSGQDLALPKPARLPPRLPSVKQLVVSERASSMRSLLSTATTSSDDASSTVAKAQARRRHRGSRGRACLRLMRPSAEAISLAVAISLPPAMAWIMVSAHFGGLAIFVGFMMPLLGVVAFLVTPLAVEVSVTKLELRRSTEASPNYLTKGLSDGMAAVAQKASWLQANRGMVLQTATTKLSQGVGDCVSRQMADIIPRLIQTCVGVFAMVSAFVLLTSLHIVPVMAALIMGVCTLVQVGDCFGWLFGEVLGIAAVVHLRQRVNERKDEIEETCTRAADGLVQRARALAIILLRRCSSPPPIPELLDPSHNEPMGSRWVTVGATKPERGQEIVNEALARALRTKREFTAEELSAFEMVNSGSNDYILVQGAYFQREEAPSRNATGAPRVRVSPFVGLVIDKLDEVGAVTRSSPLKCLVTTLNLVVVADGIRLSGKFEQFDPSAMARHAAVAVQSFLGTPNFDPDKLRAHLNAFFKIPSIPAAYASASTLSRWRRPTQCQASHPCQVLGFAKAQCSDASFAWFSSGVTPSISVRYKHPVRTSRVAIYYQLQRHSDAASKQGGNIHFTLHLSVNHEASSHVVNVTTVIGGTSWLRLVRPLERVATLREASWRTQTAPLQPSCPRPALLDLPGSTALVKTITLWPPCCDQARAVTIGIMAIVLAGSEVDSGLGATEADDDLADLDGVETDVKVSADDSLEDELDDAMEGAEDSPPDSPGDGGGDGANTGAEPTATRPQGVADSQGASGGQGATGTGTAGSGQGTSGGYGAAGGSASSMPPLGGVAAAASAATVAAASTEFVRKKTRPAEHQEHVKREDEKWNRKVIRKKAEVELDQMLASPVNPDALRKLALGAHKRGVDAALTEAALAALARAEAARNLAKAFASAGRASAIDFYMVKSGGGGAPAGTGAKMLQQADRTLCDAIEQARRLGLPASTIADAQATLDSLRSKGGTSSTETSADSA